MVNPRFSGGKPTMFICGNDAAAKKTVSEIIVQFGWEPADCWRCRARCAADRLRHG
jgi:hypothetical protein